MQSNGIDVPPEWSGPHHFGAAGYRSWVEDGIRRATNAVLEDLVGAKTAA